MHNDLPVLERPIRQQAGGALFAVRGDRLGVQDAVVTSPKRQFEAGSPHQVSGTVAAETVTAPDHQPRDLAPKKMTASRNIAQNRSIFHPAAHFPQMSDLARHEQPSPRQTD